MPFFRNNVPARVRQTEESRKLYGFTEKHFAQIAATQGTHDLSVRITAINRTVTLLEGYLRTSFEVSGVATIGSFNARCTIHSVVGEMTDADRAPANVVSGWEFQRRSVMASAQFNGHYTNPDKNDLTYQETVPAFTVAIPEKFFNEVIETHMRAGQKHAGFRLNRFRGSAGESLVQDWSWRHFYNSVIEKGDSPLSWEILSSFLVTWESRSFESPTHLERNP